MSSNQVTSEMLIVRSIFKMASALNNLDELEGIEEPQYFTGKFKRDFHKFCEFFVHHTREMAKEMAAQDPEAWFSAVYYHIDGIDEMVQEDGDPELKQIGLLLSKLTSGLRDLKSLDRTLTMKLFSEPMINRLGPILTKSYVRRIPINKQKFDRLTNIVTQTVESIAH
jgi:hypothetical protein